MSSCGALLLLVHLFQYSTINGLDYMGPVDLTVNAINQCSDPDQYVNKFIIQKQKINRTHDAYDLEVILEEDLDNNTGVYINFAKWGDGGYKPNFVIFEDPNVCALAEKFMKKTLTEILQAMHQPARCPVKIGKYTMKKFLMDYSQLPEVLFSGEFRTDFYLQKNGKHNLCIQIFITSSPKRTFG